jgi:hypothetical protein
MVVGVYDGLIVVMSGNGFGTKNNLLSTSPQVETVNFLT